ncbi:MAG TPA: nickel ABC transporter ATP-binding protein [Firmicutes bacterium]|jgi:cobalt/nickel transport system ATP-binding protein|nr:nickel ABC transporter ATP-binding protein [Bacillota bacterium]
MAEIIYSLKRVSYNYMESMPVLSNIDLSIVRGEKLVILGANGCGKSTLLKLLDGLIFPAGGEMKTFQHIISELDPYSTGYEFRKKIGFIFQDSDTQLFCPSVLDEVAFAPLQMGLERDVLEKKVAATLKDFELEELSDRPPYRLSGGEKKKVALAAVTIYNPEVLLLDEPTNSLDPRTKKWLLNRLEEINQKGTTIVMATHDLDIGRNFADRIVVMNEQHGIEAIARPEEIFANNRLLAEVNLI